MNWKAGAVMIFLGVMLAAQVLKGGALDKLTASSTGGDGAQLDSATTSTTPAPNAAQAALAPTAQPAVLL